MQYPKSFNLWLPSYLRGRARRLISSRRPAKRLWVALTDHFEPMGGEVSLDVGLKRVAHWEDRWPTIADAAPRDSAGRPPCFTFFYPQEEYRYEILAILAELSRTGTTDVEIHLHHFNDNAASFTEKVRVFKRQLHEDHGLLHHHHGQLVFGFIHGNWALDNSHPTGWGCGVTGELQLLRDLGCYADFTMPSLPSPTQSRIVNQIYWTTGDPARPRGFDTGIEATVGGGTRGDLLMITGPTGARFRDRLLPRLETGEVAVYDPPTPYRVERWIDLAPRIGDDIFVKLFGHSARPDNAASVLGSSTQPGTLPSLFRWVHEAAAKHNLELHWVSAFDMFRAVENLIQPPAAGLGMKVAVVTSYFPISTHPWNGHSAYQTLRLLAGLCDLRVFYPEPAYPDFLQSKETFSGFDRNWNPPDVSATYVPFPVFPVISRPFNGYTAAARLYPHVRDFRPDLILNYMVYPDGLAAVRIAHRLGIPSVLTAIGSDLNRPSDALVARLTRQTLHRATFVTTVSHHLCATALRLGAPAGRTRAILNGCDTSVFHPRDRSAAREQLGLDQAAEIVLYVGRLDVRKGLLELVESVAQLRATRPRLHCYIIGDGPAKPALLEFIATHQVADAITITGPYYSSEVAVWMAAANLVTLPSYNEGCPNVVVEALSAGCPVVATNVGGIPELMDSTCGRLVPARDVPALTQAFAEVLDQPWDAEAIASAHSRSWSDVAHDLHAIFKEVVSV